MSIISSITNYCPCIVRTVEGISSQIGRIKEAVVEFFSNIATGIAEWASNTYNSLKNYCISEPDGVEDLDIEADMIDERDPNLVMLEYLHTDVPTGDLEFLQKTVDIEKAFCAHFGVKDADVKSRVKSLLALLALRTYILADMETCPDFLKPVQSDLSALELQYLTLTEQQQIEFIDFRDYASDPVKTMLTTAKSIGKTLNTPTVRGLVKKLTI